MRNFFRFGFMTIALAFVFSAAALTETKAQACTEVFDRLDAHTKALQSLQANVMMQKYDAGLEDTEPLIEGTFKYVPKTQKNERHIRIDWTKPVEESIAVKGNSYTLYRPRLGQVIEGKTDDAKNDTKTGGALSFLSMKKPELKANYTCKFINRETVSGTPTVHIELTSSPKNTSSYKVVHLWVDSNGMVIQAKAIQKNNDSTTIRLSNLKKNEVFKETDFVITYPKNIRPIKG